MQRSEFPLVGERELAVSVPIGAVSLTRAIVDKWDAYVTYTPGKGYSLMGAPKSGTPNELSLINKQLEIANKLVQALPNASWRRPGQQGGSVGAESTSGGVDKLEGSWWWMDMYLTHEHAQAMANTLSTAGTWAPVVSLLGLWFPPAALALLVASTVSSSIFISLADAIRRADQGNGVIIRFYCGVPWSVRPQ